MDFLFSDDEMNNYTNYYNEENFEIEPYLNNFGVSYGNNFYFKDKMIFEAKNKKHKNKSNSIGNNNPILGMNNDFNMEYNKTNFPKRKVKKYNFKNNNNYYNDKQKNFTNLDNNMPIVSSSLNNQTNNTPFIYQPKYPKKGINNNNHNRTSKLNEPPLSTMNERKKFFKRGYSIRIGNERPKIHGPTFISEEKKDIQKERIKTENQSQSHNKILYYNNKLKSQTKINQNLNRIPEKKSFHKKKRSKSIDKMEEKSSSPKKISQKKIISPKKMINSIHTNNKKSTTVFQKNNKKTKERADSTKKYISGGIGNKKKIFNNNDNSKNINNNGAPIISAFKINSGMHKKPVNKNFKRYNTGINKIYHFRGNEIKLKENNI